MATEENTGARDRFWHRLTLLTLGLTALIALCYLVVFFVPSLLEGLARAEKPTPTLVKVLSLPKPTLTPSATRTPVATWTYTPAPPPSYTPTATTTRTPFPSSSPSPTFPPTWTAMATVGTPPPTRSNYPFALQNNEIKFTQYFFSSECNWLGIAGLVLDKQEDPVIGLPVVLNGGGLQNVITYSGNAPAYGQSGWEHFVDNKVKEGDFTVQLYDNQGQPISDQIQVRTRADCRANLIWIVFELNWDEYVP